MTSGKLFRAARERLGLTQEELSFKLKWRLTHIQEIEDDSYNFEEIYDFEKLATFLLSELLN